MQYDAKTDVCVNHGALGTWVTQEHLNNFGDIEKWTRCAVEMIKSPKAETAAYIEKYFWDVICSANRENITFPLKYYFIRGLKAGDQIVINKLRNIIEWEEDHPWWHVFEVELKNYPEIKYDPDRFPF